MQRRKIPKTLSGIETRTLVKLVKLVKLVSRKIPKTLSGIETLVGLGISVSHCFAGKYLKPYQGLKLVIIQNRLDALKPENT